jgi:hypothetical protein
MKKKIGYFMRRIDWILVFRLSLSAMLIISGYIKAANPDMLFGCALAIYSILAARFHWGCGYGNCTYAPPVSEVSKNQLDQTNIQ